MASSATSLPYHEPDIVTILVLTSFLLIANAINWALDRLVYCGLIGQILIGIAWGTPGGKWLNEAVETTIVQFGYLGLILLVYEGGLSTNFQSLKANLILSIFVALTGIAAPIGLSFILGSLVDATPLQSFAAGAALCSTSLGTTFTILGTTGLLKTRLGVVLTSAAMLDDVVGLVMVQVISNLGGASDDFSATTVVRPVFVSLGFALICPVVCWLVLKPATLKLSAARESNKAGLINRTLVSNRVVFGLHTALLVGMVTASSYAGTSNLFAAYLAGAIVSWWDSEVPHVFLSRPTAPSEDSKDDAAIATPVAGSETGDLRNGTTIYEMYFQPANDRVLKPFFFTSIGFSIPITRMFNGATVWRGVIYSILMLFVKLLCGLWLIRFSLSLPQPATIRRLFKPIQNLQIPHLWGKTAAETAIELETKRESTENASAAAITQGPITDQDQDAITPSSPSSSAIHSAPTQTQVETVVSPHTEPAKKPLSLYPAAILGLAMVARGEIGFLISSLAESNGIFSANGNEQVFLVVTWAIVLCTLIGPICVGLLVRRVKALDKARGEDGKDALGVWGVS